MAQIKSLYKLTIENALVRQNMVDRKRPKFLPRLLGSQVATATQRRQSIKENQKKK